MSNIKKEVVVTGLGPVSSVGIGNENYWKALKKGRSGIKHISLFDTKGLSCCIGGEIDNQWISEDGGWSKKKVSRSTNFIINAARLALKDAGITEAEFAAGSPAIFVGSSTTDMDIVEKEYLSFKAVGLVQSTSVFSSSPHAAASELASEFKCSGKAITIATGCSAGLVSIASGAEAILRGEADMVLAGGGDAPLTPFLLASFTSAGLLSTRYNDNPTLASRPFDAKRDRGILSEGAGMLLLESAEKARERKARIYGKIGGWGMSNASSPKAMKSAFRASIADTLKMAYFEPEKVDYICANAPGDILVDKMEVKAIKDIFGTYAYNLPISSIKSMIGYPLAGCGPLQVIAALKAMQDNFVPPTLNYKYPEAGFDLDFVPEKGRTSRVNSALVNLSGLGGSIISLLVT